MIYLHYIFKKGGCFLCGLQSLTADFVKNSQALISTPGDYSPPHLAVGESRPHLC